MKTSLKENVVNEQLLPKNAELKTKRKAQLGEASGAKTKDCLKKKRGHAERKVEQRKGFLLSVKWRRIRRKRYPSAHGGWEAVPRVGRCKADRLIAGPRDSRSRDRSGIAAVHEEGGLTFVLPEAGQGAAAKTRPQAASVPREARSFPPPAPFPATPGTH